MGATQHATREVLSVRDMVEKADGGSTEQQLDQTHVTYAVTGIQGITNT